MKDSTVKVSDDLNTAEVSTSKDTRDSLVRGGLKIREIPITNYN